MATKAEDKQDEEVKDADQDLLKRFEKLEADLKAANAKISKAESRADKAETKAAKAALAATKDAPKYKKGRTYKALRNLGSREYNFPIGSEVFVSQKPGDKGAPEAVVLDWLSKGQIA